MLVLEWLLRYLRFHLLSKTVGCLRLTLRGVLLQALALRLLDVCEALLTG